MFNRSVKYIFLLCLNIVVLVALYQRTEDTDNSVFDTEFVVDLLAQRDNLQSSVNDAQMQLDQIKSQIASSQEMLNLAEREIAVRSRQFQRCEDARITAVSLVNEQAVLLAQPQTTQAANMCSDENVKLRFASQELASTKAELRELKQENQRLEQAIEERQSQDRLALEIEALKKQNEQLRSDIDNPIYLKSAYLSGQKCEQPRFEELVCLRELLVRPAFSKMPSTEVQVTVYDANDRKVAEGSFTSKRAQLLRLPLGRGKEVPVGELKATFEVEGQVIASTGHSITR